VELKSRRGEKRQFPGRGQKPRVARRGSASWAIVKGGLGLEFRTGRSDKYKFGRRVDVGRRERV